LSQLVRRAGLYHDGLEVFPVDVLRNMSNILKGGRRWEIGILHYYYKLNIVDI